MRTEFK